MKLTGQVTRFLHAEDGLLSAAMLILMPLLLFAAAIAIDTTGIAAEKRYVQSQADMAALSAIRNFTTPDEMRDAARRTIGLNRFYRNLPTPDSQIQIGNMVDGEFAPAADQSTLIGSSAVRVIVKAEALMYLMQLFLSEDDLVVAREAIAIQQPRVSFGLSNCLLSLQLLRPILQPLLDSQVDVLCSGRGIDTAISGKGFLDGLATQASLLTPSGSALTYGDILDAQLPVSWVLEEALHIPVSGGSETVRLADFIYFPTDLRSIRIGQPLPPLTLNAADIAFATAELLGERVAEVNVGVDLPSVGTVQARVLVGDPRQIVLGAIPGDPEAVARTSQIRLELPAVNIAGLFNLTMKLDVANAAARLTNRGSACSQWPDDEVAVFDPVSASLIDLDLQLEVLGLPLNLAPVGEVASNLAPRVVEEISYTRAEAETAPIRTIGPSLAPDIVAIENQIRLQVASMLTTTQTLLGGSQTTSCTNPLGCLVNTALNTAAQQLNSVMGWLQTATVNVQRGTGLDGAATQSLIHDVIGLEVAQADLELLYAGCPMPPRLAR